MYSLSSLKEMILASDLVKDQVEQINKSGVIILHNVSFSLAAIAFLFLIAFGLDYSIYLSAFFLSISIAFILIPLLARQGYENTSKFLLLSYVDISIIILSSIFGEDMLIQAFYIPACGLAFLLFDKEHTTLRNLGIALAVGCYLVLDYIIFDKVYLTANEGTIIQYSILGAAFITTWMTFNKFSESKELAEKRTQELLEETRLLNEELIGKKEELEENLTELKGAKNEIEEGSKAKSEFLSTMSHEIRTPMNAIIGMSNLLVRDDPREDQLEQLEILDFSAKTLLALINDILDFSKIESGRIEFENIAFDPEHLINGVLESFRFTADKKEVPLYVDIESELPYLVVGDPNRLTQILNNLVSNAVKFTEEGSVGIVVEEVQKDSDYITLLFKVIDTGIGITQEKQKEIFESFTQERTDTSRVFGGTGLGLTISKKLVELQGGNIYMESEKEKGSTFFVEMSFEIEKESEEKISIFKQHATPGNLKGSTVLLVEDNSINQKVMTRFLDKWDIKVLVAENGKKAVEMIKTNFVNLVLMDLQMPEMDGYEATRLIRGLEDKQRSSIPIIALTAAALKEVREKVFATGMDDYLTKPFNPIELQEKLESHILNKKSEEPMNS